jgi:ethanolamine transporter EutH
VIVGASVTVFAAILIAEGYDLPEALMGAGAAGLVAGEVAGRMLGTVPRPWQGV